MINVNRNIAVIEVLQGGACSLAELELNIGGLYIFQDLLVSLENLIKRDIVGTRHKVEIIKSKGYHPKTTYITEYFLK